MKSRCGVPEVAFLGQDMSAYNEHRRSKFNNVMLVFFCVLHPIITSIWRRDAFFLKLIVTLYLRYMLGGLRIQASMSGLTPMASC